MSLALTILKVITILCEKISLIHININLKSGDILDCLAKDLKAYCEQYEQGIKR